MRNRVSPDKFVIVTVNIDDYAPLFRRRAQQGESHPGVVYITSKHPKNAYHIARKLASLNNQDMTNREIWI